MAVTVPKGEGTVSVALILKAKGAHVETTRPDTTLYAVVWDLKVKAIEALLRQAGLSLPI